MPVYPVWARAVQKTAPTNRRRAVARTREYRQGNSERILYCTVSPGGVVAFGGCRLGFHVSEGSDFRPPQNRRELYTLWPQWQGGRGFWGCHKFIHHEGHQGTRSPIRGVPLRA